MFIQFLSNQLVSKDVLTRSPDLEIRPKNRIFDLDRLRAIEEKKYLKQKLKKQSKSETL